MLKLLQLKCVKYNPCLNYGSDEDSIQWLALLFVELNYRALGYCTFWKYNYLWMLVSFMHMEETMPTKKRKHLSDNQI